MLRVFAGYADGGLHPETYRALVKNVPIGSLEMVNVTGKVSNYWHEFRKRWIGKFDLMTVEQDNVITPDIIPSFQMCDEPWCTYEYIGPPHMIPNGAPTRMLDQSLGCSRFSRELQRAVPIEMISKKEYFSWYLIDYRLSLVLRREGYLPHVHGEVKHLHNYSEAPAQTAKEHQLFTESINLTKADPKACLAHVGLEESDGILNPDDPGYSREVKK